MSNRPVFRYLAAAVSAAVAIVYFLIAAGVISVVSTAPRSADWIIPAAAGAAFALLAVLLMATERRIVPALGAAMSVLTIAGYFVVAPNRTPSIEAWGISIKIAQAFLLFALGYLALVRSDSGARHPTIAA